MVSTENGDSNRNGHVLVQQMERDNEVPPLKCKSKVYQTSAFKNAGAYKVIVRKKAKILIIDKI